MKTLLIAVAFVLSTSTAFATQWTCKAFCLEVDSQDILLIVDSDPNPQMALDNIAKKCAEVNYVTSFGKIENVILYSSGADHREKVTIVNSCKMFDPAE